MMRVETIEQQILPALRSFWDRYRRGEPLQEALRAAVRDVAVASKVRQQTVIDGLTRRLQGDIGELYGLLKQWTDGDPGPLASQLKASSDRSAHESMDAFFGSCGGNAIPRSEVGGHFTSGVKSERFCFDLPQREARMLRAVAEMESVSEVALVGQMVRTALAAKMKTAADELMR